MNVHMPFPAPKVCCCLPIPITWRRKYWKMRVQCQCYNSTNFGPLVIFASTTSSSFQPLMRSGPLGFWEQAIGQVITTNEPWRAHHRIKGINQPMSMSLCFYWFFSSWSPRCVWKNLPRQWKPKRLSKVLVMMVVRQVFSQAGSCCKNDVGVSKTSMQHKFG